MVQGSDPFKEWAVPNTCTTDSQTTTPSYRQQVWPAPSELRPGQYLAPQQTCIHTLLERDQAELLFRLQSSEVIVSATELRLG